MNSFDVSRVNHPVDQIMTVCGAIPVPKFGVVDAHNHTWIEPVPGENPGPFLNHHEQILAELKDYAQAGGVGIIDCQPGGCGRNGIAQRSLMSHSGVFIVAATGYHLPKYYPPSWSIWQMDEQNVYQYFFDELQVSLAETVHLDQPVRAGFIKIACQDTLEQTPESLLQAVIAVCKDTSCAIEIHTEKGAGMVHITEYFEKKGVDLHSLVLCHVDKNPDFGIHAELAQAGVMLEYDTFFRPKYRPESNLWPLLEKMLANGFADRVALATDMAESEFWKTLGSGPGLASLSQVVRARLNSLGVQPAEIDLLTGLNISGRIARPITNNY
jgi:phosphotriesterase-related protein